MRNYKAGIIGCGRPSAGIDANMQGFSIAYSHGHAFKSNEVIIAAATDISAENAKAYADHFQVSATYSDYKEMIDNEQLDIVSVCTWPTLHKEMVLYAAVAGVKMIWCEKPMAVGLDEVDEMVRVCKEYGTRLFINHQRRYDWPFQITRMMIDDGVLGKVERLEAWVGSGWDLMSWGTHWVDMHRFLMHDEDVEWVVAAAPHSGKIRYGHPVEDHMLLQFGFKSGTLSTIHLGNHLVKAGLRVVGTEGSVSFDDGGANFVLQHSKEDPEILMRQYKERAPKVTGMNAAVGDMIAAFEKNQLGEIDVENGAKSTEIVMAAYLSAAEKKKLSLPLENRSFNLLRDYK